MSHEYLLLFSVATTSTKPPPIIKEDIRRVLDRMQVQYRETKGGFECIHLPSIDVSSLQDPPRQSHHLQQASSGSNDTGTTAHHRPSIVRKASKLSFGLKREKKDKGVDKDKEVVSDKEKESPSRPSGATVLTTTASSGSSSFFNVSSNHTVVADTGTPRPTHNGISSTEVVQLPPRSASPTKGKGLPPIPHDFSATPRQLSPTPLPTGEIDRELFESMGNNTMSVRFEINIVKVSVVGGSFRAGRRGTNPVLLRARCHGCPFMESSSVGLAGMGGNTK
jgi:hypothetical protein